MWYVDITGIPDEYLEFLGYVLVTEDADFKLYRDYSGADHIVRKSQPLLLVDDPNDVAILNRYRKGGGQGVFRAPPPTKPLQNP